MLVMLLTRLAGLKEELEDMLRASAAKGASVWKPGSAEKVEVSLLRLKPWACGRLAGWISDWMPWRCSIEDVR